MIKKYILSLMSLMLLVASFQGANAGLGSINTDKTENHYSSMLKMNMGDCCECDNKSSCQSACLGSISCLEKNIYNEVEIKDTVINSSISALFFSAFVLVQTRYPALLLRPPQTTTTV